MDFRGYYDTILTLGDRLVLFKGPTAYFYGRRFDLKKLIPGHVMNTGVDAWMHLDNGERVVAREGYLYHWNTRKMMPLLDYFYDLRPPFVSVDERCRKIADRNFFLEQRKRKRRLVEVIKRAIAVHVWHPDCQDWPME